MCDFGTAGLAWWAWLLIVVGAVGVLACIWKAWVKGCCTADAEDEEAHAEPQPQMVVIRHTTDSAPPPIASPPPVATPLPAAPEPAYLGEPRPRADQGITTKQLLQACKNGNSAQVSKLLLLPGINPNERLEGTSGYMPLHVAAEDGWTRIAELLIADPRTDVNARTSDDMTALHLAAGNGHLDVVDRLLRCPKVDAAARVRGVLTVLMVATMGVDETVGPVVSRLLRDPRTDANVRSGPNLETALMYAARAGSAAAVRALLDSGLADPTLKARNGKTAVDVSVPELKPLLAAAVETWGQNEEELDAAQLLDTASWTLQTPNGIHHHRYYPAKTRPVHSIDHLFLSVSKAAHAT
ncbi:ankyrin repeat-containing domain protein [Hyaloraphidium curvatum]|nr:ankyrin repeat-containing domain protein [Hyaloraphidium curvatum]